MSEDIKQVVASVATSGEYVWPCWWGGATRSATPPQIPAKMRDLRIKVGGVKATKQAGGPMFPVKSAKDLANKLGQALCDLDMVAPVISQEVQLIPTDAIPGNVTGSGKPVFRTLAHVKATVRIGAPDGSYVDVVGSGHGGDVDDKAGGKATTYAWKDAILKGLTTPEQDMVDTDDSSSDAPAARGKAVLDEPAADPKAAGEAARVIALFAAAPSVEALDELAARVKSGEFALAGADRLRATQAYVSRKKLLQAANAS